jgi:hypothetical protein
MKNSIIFTSFEECMIRNPEVAFWWRDDDVGVSGRRHIVLNWIENRRLETMLALSAKYNIYAIFAVIPYKLSSRGIKSAHRPYCRCLLISAEISKSCRNERLQGNAVQGVREVLVYRRQSVFYSKFRELCLEGERDRAFLKVAPLIPDRRWTPAFRYPVF